MSLPGKLCIGILEEDKPQKSYFCFKPLLIEEDGKYIAFDSTAAYPEDGCIRIVPDKNESSHFKARMRRMGLFAVVDLRDHPGENDKIRQNKNYHGDDEERNANIIYSDVVREPAPDMIYALLRIRPEDADGLAVEEPISTPCALLRPEDAVLQDVWVSQTDEDSQIIRLQRAERQIQSDQFQVFDLEGFGGKTISFAILPPDKVDSVIDEPEIQIAEPKREPHPQEARPAEAPVDPEKPWITHVNMPQPRISPDLPPFERTLAVQSGLNPRRGRSLQEIIDDKWKRSRLEQLGLPVPDIHTVNPVASPAERAVEALRTAWANRDQRQSLLDAISSLDGAQQAMEAGRVALRESAVNEQLNELEAQRLEMLGEIEKLKRRGSDIKNELKEEIRTDEAAEFADAVQKTQAAKADCAHWQDEAERAKAAAESVQDALRAMEDGRFDDRLRDYAINSRAAELLRHPEELSPIRHTEDGVSATAEEIIHRVRACFQDAGCPISQTDAVNLLVCASQGPVIISGAPGSGKTTMVRLLAQALGAGEDRFRMLVPGEDASKEDWAPGNAAAVTLYDDVNLPKWQDDPMRRAAGTKGILCATVQDEGYPIPAYLLERNFFVRLSDESAEAAWMPKPASNPKTEAPISCEAFRQAFSPDRTGTLPGSVLKRMERLRADLSLVGIKLSRGTLNALWRYCAAAIPLMPLDPMAVLDIALSERAIPTILAQAPLDALKALPKLLADLPRCRALLDQPLPIDL